MDRARESGDADVVEEVCEIVSERQEIGGPVVEQAVRLYARRWGAHPGYREEWRPVPRS